MFELVHDDIPYGIVIVWVVHIFNSLDTDPNAVTDMQLYLD